MILPKQSAYLFPILLFFLFSIKFLWEELVTNVTFPLRVQEVPLRVQEDEIQTNPKESAKIPVMAELLSPVDETKNDLETDMTHEQL